MQLALGKWRDKRNASQQEIADVAGVSVRTIGSWEGCKTFPNAEQLWKIALFLHCTPNDLLEWEDPNDRKLTDDECEIVDNYRDSSPQWKKNISMTAKAAADDSRREQ